MTITASALSAAFEPASDDEILTFSEALLGLPGALSYRLVAVDDETGLFALEAGATRLFLVEPARYIDGYCPRLTATQRAVIGIASDDDARVFVVVTPDPEGPTANLLAPIVVAPGGRASQVLLEDQEMPVRAPLQVAAAG